MRQVGHEYQLREIKVKIQEIEAKKDRIVQEIAEISKRIKQYDVDQLPISLQIEDLKAIIEGLEAKIRQKKEEISRLRALIASLRTDDNFDPSKLAALELREQELSRRLQKAVGDLNRQKDEILEKIRRVEAQILKLRDDLLDFDTTIRGYIIELNTQLNDCKRHEIIIRMFMEQYEVKNRQKFIKELNFFYCSKFLNFL